MCTLLAIILFIIVLYVDVQSDYKRLTTNTIKHGRGAIIRTVALLPTFVLLLLPIGVLVFWKLLIKTIVISGMIGGWWWELFDGFLNIRRGESWRYNGSDDPDDANTDNFLQNYTSVQQALIKWGIIVLFTISYIIIKYVILL